MNDNAKVSVKTFVKETLLTPAAITAYVFTNAGVTLVVVYRYTQQAWMAYAAWTCVLLGLSAAARKLLRLSYLIFGLLVFSMTLQVMDTYFLQKWANYPSWTALILALLLLAHQVTRLIQTRDKP